MRTGPKQTFSFSLKITEDLHQAILEQAESDYRKFTDQVRYLLTLGLESNRQRSAFLQGRTPKGLEIED